MPTSKSETDLLHQAKPYETGTDPQSWDLPLGDAEFWPRWLQRHVYSKFHRANYLAGSVLPGGGIESAWLAGLSQMFEAVATIAPATWNAAMQGLSTFFSTGNSVDANIIVTDTSVNVASQAAFTLTVPAGHAYKVSLATFRNSTRAPTGSIAYTPNGGTASIFNCLTQTQSETVTMIGGFGVGAGSVSHGIIGPLWMQVGDTLEISNDNFVAADVMRHDFIFEDYAL